jgi:thiosulfate dehydrogenase [quinone] large subunit
VAFDWYRDFLLWLLSVGAEGFFGKLITYGQVLVGVALIFGAFVGLAAFFGAFMNWNFMMAGTASTNPMMFLVSLLLVLAWKVAGYYGLDRWLLPALGTPWRPGRVFQARQPTRA